MADIAALPLADIRAERLSARRSLELHRMRAQADDPEAAQTLAELQARVGQLTDALIARYAADLSLVDSLLDGTYARGAAARGPSDHQAGES